MSSNAHKLGMRKSHRYRIGPADNNTIRFFSNKNKRILTTSIFDISETGISFITSLRSAPPVGEIIKMDFVPFGKLQIACLGRVVRIERASKNSSWANSSDNVKVGIELYDLPPSYKKMISESLVQVIGRQQKSIKRYKSPSATGIWLRENYLSASIALAILMIVGFAIFWVIDNLDTIGTNHEESQWAKGFFDKAIQQTK